MAEQAMSLEEVEAGLGLVGPSGPPEVSKPPGPAKVSYTHDKMIDYILSQPRITQQQLSVIFGYTPAWISQIMSSDAFKERLAVRRAEVTDPAIQAALDCWFPTTTEKMQNMVDKSLDILAEKLHGTKVSDATALRAFELGARGLGVGGFSSKVPEAPTKPDADRLERLADRLTGLIHTKQKEVIDGEVIPQTAGEGA